MQKIIFYIGILFLVFISKMSAQNHTFENKAKEIANRIETITKEEKKALKLEVEAIDLQLNEGKITKQQADELKLKAAEKRAAIIEEKVALEETKLQQLIQDKVDGGFSTSKVENELPSRKDSIIVKGKKYEVTYHVTDSSHVITDIKRIFKRDSSYVEKRTTSQFVIAFGWNNLVTDGAIANSDYYYWRSMFSEFGITWRTNLIKDHKVLNLKYGLSFVYNQLHPTDNRYFVDNGEQTVLETYPVNLKSKRSYFRNVFLTLPVHLEFDFSKMKERNNRKYYASHTGFRLGVGGFVGYNTNSKQFLNYDEEGYDMRIRQKGNWNIDDWNYGLSTYVGYGTWSLYMKYDINPMFKNNTTKQNNISLGIRMDLN
ncbi:conserved hypothetical protein [Flavobacterium sp. 9AF]|uniref:hypothetical protein n=1 Tax=Flavobacterium sp. 9AF TaxID=2653142 RepID=UPI0012F3550D|nr:hypothetical protein [Flavobacterium sp. 9AF]VXB10786.1 conserved hypothetical protein [Flavobacterium sp. 9AF]